MDNYVLYSERNGEAIPNVVSVLPCHKGEPFATYAIKRNGNLALQKPSKPSAVSCELKARAERDIINPHHQ